MSSEERDSLIAAFLGCTGWRVEMGGAVVGEHAGWRVWLSDVGGTETGFAANQELDVTVELTPPLIRAWLDRVRERFLRN